MGYKFKPSKSVAKRFTVTKTGKLKRHHSNTSHLMSSRPANKRRKLRKPEVLFEGHARNMRKAMGISHLNPVKTAHERGLAEQQQQDQPADSGQAKPVKPAASAKPATSARRARVTE